MFDWSRRKRILQLSALAQRVTPDGMQKRFGTAVIRPHGQSGRGPEEEGSEQEGSRR
jgi:hypothetical protein